DRLGREQAAGCGLLVSHSTSSLIAQAGSARYLSTAAPVPRVLAFGNALIIGDPAEQADRRPVALLEDAKRALCAPAGRHSQRRLEPPDVVRDDDEPGPRPRRIGSGVQEGAVERVVLAVRAAPL